MDVNELAPCLIKNGIYFFMNAKRFVNLTLSYVEQINSPRAECFYAAFLEKDSPNQIIGILCKPKFV